MERAWLLARVLPRRNEALAPVALAAGEQSTRKRYLLQLRPPLLNLGAPQLGHLVCLRNPAAASPPFPNPALAERLVT